MQGTGSPCWRPGRSQREPQVIVGAYYYPRANGEKTGFFRPHSQKQETLPASKHFMALPENVLSKWGFERQITEDVGREASPGPSLSAQPS